jgi:integrase
MASIDKRPDGKYRARWREYPTGPQKTKTFVRKVDAGNFLVDVQHRMMSGTYVPPHAGQVTLADYAAEWTNRRHWRPATAERIERELRVHIIPTLGEWPLASLRRSHIEQWAASLQLGPSSVGTVTQTLAAMLSAAVEDERLVRNPAVGARLPQVESAPVVPMTAEAVRALALAAPGHVRAAVLLAAGTGLRQGEAFGLTADRVDFLRRELRVDRQMWTPRSGPPVLAPPKSKNSYRTIALSPLVTDGLAAHLANFKSGRDGLVFHTGGNPIVRATVGRYVRQSAARAGEEAARAAIKGLHGTAAALAADTARAGFGGRTWHDLRHHHASVLLSAGVSPALVAERLGHNIATLLKTYAHVIRKDEDRVRSIVDDVLGASGTLLAEDWLRTEAI